MGSKIAIIGLGQIGASMGLALKARAGAPKVVGFDSVAATRRAAEGLEAVDSTASLIETAKDAAILLLCLPLGEIRETLRHIAPVIENEAVLLDTAPSKRQVEKWFRESIPTGRYYVGLSPAVNPEVLAEHEGGIEGARPDLFRRTVMLVAAPPNTPAEVEQLALNLCKMLGAKPLLADLAEADGLMAAAHILPQLTSAALMEAAEAAEGWVETRKIAGQPFASVTGGAAYFDEAASLEQAALANPTTLVHALDVVVASLQGMRNEIEAGDNVSLGERLRHSFNARERWLDARGAADWLAEGGEPAELPELGEQIMRAMFGGRIVDRNKPKKKARD